MRIFHLAFLLLLVSALTSCKETPVAGQTPSLASLARRAAAPATEEAWIQSDIIASIASLSGRDEAGSRGPLTVVDHVWSPATYTAMATPLVAPGPASVAAANDLDVRRALLNLSTTTLLDEDVRISAALLETPRSPAAHEAAALLLGAFALREAAGWLDDVRPALNRMTAHLTLARVLRSGGAASPDGVVADAVLMTLIGRQSDAMTLVAGIERGVATDTERAWAAALRLRNTGDWRTARPVGVETPLEQFEHARALGDRLGHDALLTYLDGLPESRHDAVELGRIAMIGPFTVEAGNRFTPHNVARELDEATAIRRRYQQGEVTSAQVMEMLNERPTARPSDRRHRVIDWGMWAGQQQRHLLHASITAWHHAGNFDGRQNLARLLTQQYASLALFPIFERWIAESPAAYTRALERARALVVQRPEFVTQAAWGSLLKPPTFVTRPAPFPIDTTWFTPPVPTGTAFDLAERALKPGCPRPPSRATAQLYAKQRPYDHWAVWANEWYAVDGSPSIASVARAMRPLFEYDTHANLKMLEHMPLTEADQVEYGKRLCALTAGECSRLGELYLLTGRNQDAVSVLERWVALARDRVTVSNNVMWLIRFYEGTGDQTRAEATARMAADVGSARGLDAFGDWLDRRGRHDEAEVVYERIAARYASGDYLAGSFLWRKAARTNDAAARDKAGELLRAVFPTGVETLQRHALDAVPADGAAFLTFGERPAALGLRATDIIVGVDDVRVRNARQFQVASRFSHDPTMTLMVWRENGYEHVTARVPERLLGTRLSDYPRR